ncbi:hypothetical protein GGR88_002143 [Sphingomonas jejuensis]|uniref:Extensin-like C-terminal domain-containing protein n=1 Tax=Sphingomonas jejuensis TaxID=904715 RepID=A0ABX0XPB7_9SPHN|nr:extensin family protein [Sphingomonas jejuensis]NJC34629.1 hypothetical protein [Sphingomonas jejuensis]
MIGWLHRALRLVVVLALLAAGALALYAFGRSRPGDVPWTPLDLADQPGMFTGRKLAGLRDDAPRCQALLDKAGVRYTALPPRGGDQCGYDDAVRLTGGGALSVGWRPDRPGVACPVAAALAMFEWRVLQPAAQVHLGTSVTAIDHFGSYSCRRLYGRDAGAWSEHATANAIDIAGFRTADGRRITLVNDWAGGTAEEQAFLRAIRDGACRLFATVLSPDYNAAHRDHFHLDQAARGALGGRACR